MREDFRIIDRLAHAYGWSIEYISQLEVNEITGLMGAIEDREETERRIQSFIVALAFCGKTLDDVIKKGPQNTVSTSEQTPKEPKKSSVEDENMIKLFQGLGMSPTQILDGVRKGKLEI